MWYPGGSFKHNHYINRAHEMVLHQVPAQLTDLVARLVGGKPFAVRLCDKMTRGMRSLEYFTTHQWSWDCGNMEQLSDSMAAKDRYQDDHPYEA